MHPSAERALTDEYGLDVQPSTTTSFAVQEVTDSYHCSNLTLD